MPEDVGGDGHHAPEYVGVGQLVLPLVHPHGHVARLAGAGVQVPVVLGIGVQQQEVMIMFGDLGQQIHVMEDEAVPGKVFQSLLEADIDKHPSVEPVRVNLAETWLVIGRLTRANRLSPADLVDEVEAVVQLLPG